MNSHFKRDIPKKKKKQRKCLPATKSQKVC